ncbi:excisionase family protein [Pseudomonas sp. D(2018)]|uniref:excisionase family protein n=1 Tax=Pseudomonas sp. D(2018) TaxID=2502238 RepID=UPI0010F65E72|nr:excisionase family protein [Pseudomonas sp. D(2018)]
MQEPLAPLADSNGHSVGKTRTLFVIQPAKWVRQELLFPIFGISPEAARKYRTTNQWCLGKHWDRDPANRIVYNRDAIEKWMMGAL